MIFTNRLCAVIWNFCDPKTISAGQTHNCVPFPIFFKKELGKVFIYLGIILLFEMCFQTLCEVLARQIPQAQREFQYRWQSLVSFTCRQQTWTGSSAAICASTLLELSDLHFSFPCSNYWFCFLVVSVIFGSRNRFTFQGINSRTSYRGLPIVWAVAREKRGCQTGTSKQFLGKFLTYQTLVRE